MHTISRLSMHWQGARIAVMALHNDEFFASLCRKARAIHEYQNGRGQAVFDVAYSSNI